MKKPILLFIIIFSILLIEIFNNSLHYYKFPTCITHVESCYPIQSKEICTQQIQYTHILHTVTHHLPTENVDNIVEKTETLHYKICESLYYLTHRIFNLLHNHIYSVKYTDSNLLYSNSIKFYPHFRNFTNNNDEELFPIIVNEIHFQPASPEPEWI